MYYDSTGKTIIVGDTVRFRGKEYTIKEFIDGGGRNGTAFILFNEEQHVTETADELSVDLVNK